MGQPNTKLNFHPRRRRLVKDARPVSLNLSQFLHQMVGCQFRLTPKAKLPHVSDHLAVKGTCKKARLHCIRVEYQTIHYGLDFQKERLRERRFFVPHSNKNQENPIYSVSSHFFKQSFSQGSS